VLTRCQEAVRPAWLDRLPQGRPVFYTAHAPLVRSMGETASRSDGCEVGLSRLTGKRVVAFAGLANNSQFFDLLAQAGSTVCHRFAFADHYPYRRIDLDRIAAMATLKGAHLLVTTLKDYVKIQSYRRHWPVELVTIDVTIRFLKDEGRFQAILAKALK
jgi:tetraacyldisaccharide 4'-kinase